MEPLWTLPELVAEIATRIAALPAPRNGQVRAIPDERTIRYYATIGLLDRPAAMRGRTALYGRRHVAQVVAIKRLQTMGRSLADILALWPTLDDVTLARMSGVALEPRAKSRERAEFWKRAPASEPREPTGVREPVEPDESDEPAGPEESHEPVEPDEPVEADGPEESHEPHEPREASPSAPPAAPAIELRVELAPGVVLSLAATHGIAVSPADARALREAAAPLVAELASRRLASHPGGERS